MNIHIYKHICACLYIYRERDTRGIYIHTSQKGMILDMGKYTSVCPSMNKWKKGKKKKKSILRNTKPVHHDTV